MNKTSKKIRKDDNVIVMAGNNKGKTGKVIRLEGEKVFIEGVNLRKKAVRPTRTSKGGILEREAGIHKSNVSVCVDNKPVKLKVRTSSKGVKELYYKEGSKEVAYRTLSPK